ncbi:peptidase M50B-like-domain-containing protein, partial [Endogone sp. FLAS-F59071]
LLTVGLHEFSHAFVGIITCARIISIEIDPDEGGLTKMRGGNPYLTLPAGYLGSSLIGAIMIFCGFNVLASKVASIFLGVCLLIVLFFARNWLTRGIGLLFMGLIVFLWWLDASALPSLHSVMSCLYCVWDILDDLVLRKVNTSDASKFAELSNTSGQCWGIIWLIISVIFLVCAVLAGLAAFKVGVGRDERGIEIRYKDTGIRAEDVLSF